MVSFLLQTPNTTYTVGDGGLTQNNFTDALKSKLDGIHANANNYSLPTASSTTLGGIKVGTNLSIDGDGVLSSTAVTLATVSNNYLSISGQSITAGIVPISLGGTGATTAVGARTALGVDAAGTDNSIAVTLANTNYLTISGQEINWWNNTYIKWGNRVYNRCRCKDSFRISYWN